MTTHAAPAARAPVRDVILRDGRTLRLRAPLAADADALLAFYASLSQPSLYRRFNGLPRLTPELVRAFVDPDWRETGSLIGELDGRIVAHAEWARLRDPTAAEVAFAVADDLQGKGAGTRLLEQLAELAGAAGIERFVAEVAAGNRPMLSVFEHVGFEVTRDLEGGSAEVSFPIAPTEDYYEHIAARDHEAVRASLRPFFEPRAVAVVGASRRRGTIGGELFRNILEGDFTGAAYPVNRGGESVAGVRGYTSVAEIPDQVDLVVISLPGEAVIGAAEEALEAGVPAVCVISAGFAEIGGEGVERQERLLALVRARGARLIGPNCLGIASAATRLNATFAGRAIPPGSVAFSSQSGALGLALLEAASSRGLGLSAFVSIGNKADVSSNDLIEYWEDDATTSVVLLYVESFGNPRKFARLARRVARKKPILAMKSGRTAAGQRAAGSHTAALAGSDAAAGALFEQSGVIRAETLEELLDVATLLSTQPPPAGPRVAVVTNAGGLGILCADACDAAGLELAPIGDETAAALRNALPAEASVANPIDMLGSAGPDAYEAVLPLLLADRAVDALIALYVPAVSGGAEDVAAAIVRAARGAEKPVLASVLSEHGVPAALRGGVVAPFGFPEAAARALGRAVERASWLRRPVGGPVALDVDRDRAEAVVTTALERADAEWLEAGEARALLEAYGIPLVAERIAATPDDAAVAARELGFPAVVKTAAAGAHKTETGGVVLNLDDESEVRAAAERIGGLVLVQPMIAGGVELLAGLVQDPVFGPLVALGPGGVFAELIGDVTLRIAPLTDRDAEEMVTSGKTGLLVSGWRGAPPADAEALQELVLLLGRLGEDIPSVAELDLNPVKAFDRGCVVVDARVRVRRPAQAPQLKTW